MAITMPDQGAAKTRPAPAKLNYAGMATGTPTQAKPMPSGYDQLMTAFQGMMPRALQGIASADASINNSIGTYGQMAGYQTEQSNLLNQQLQTALGKLDLNRQGQGINQDALNRAKAMLPQQDALQQQLYGINQNAINENRQGIEQGHQLNLADLAQQNVQLQQSYANTRQNLMGQAAAQGAGTSMGYRRNVGTLADQLQQNLASLSRSGQREGMEYGSALNSNTRATQQQDINKQQYGINYQEQLAKLADAQKNADLVAKSNGLDKEELENRTQQALGQLGLANVLQTSDIYQSIINAQNGKFDAIAPVLSFIYQLIGVRPVSNG